MAPRSKTKGRSGPPAEAAAQEVARELIAEQLALAEGLIPRVRTGVDPEDLHDLRVALRRSRSLAQLLGDVFAERSRRDLVDELRALAAPTGQLRDLDVHLETEGEQLAALPASLRPAGERVFAELARMRRVAQEALAEALESEAYRARLHALRARLSSADAWLDGPLAGASISAVAQEAIAQRYRTVRKRARRLRPQTEESRVHRFRIACKKLRYALEFFGPVLGEPKALRRLLRRLKRAQDQLGRFNDLTVQRDRLMGHVWGPDDPERTLAAGALVGLLQAELTATRPALLKGAAGLCDEALVRRVAPPG